MGECHLVEAVIAGTCALAFMGMIVFAILKTRG